MCLCGLPWYVCDIVFVPYVDAGTVKHVVCVASVYAERVCGCEGDGNTAVVTVIVGCGV